jgi:ribosome-binding factor A
MKGSSRRPEQVAATLRQVISEALLRGEVRDPRVGLVTLTHVEVTSDLSHATLHVAPAGDEAERERAVEGLQSAAGFLRSRAARALTTRTVPELHFALDRGLEHATRINRLLAELGRNDAPDGSAGPDAVEDEG